MQKKITTWEKEKSLSPEELKSLKNMADDLKAPDNKESVGKYSGELKLGSPNKRIELAHHTALVITSIMNPRNKAIPDLLELNRNVRAKDDLLLNRVDRDKNSKYLSATEKAYINYHSFIVLLMLGIEINTLVYQQVAEKFKELAKENPKILTELLTTEPPEVIKALRESKVIDEFMKRRDADKAFVFDTIGKKMTQVSAEQRQRAELPQGVVKKILGFSDMLSPHNQRSNDIKMVMAIRGEKELCRNRINSYEKLLAETPWEIKQKGTAGWLGAKIGWFGAGKYEITLSSQQKITVPYSIYEQWKAAEPMIKNDPINAWNKLVEFTNRPLHPYDQDNKQVKEFFAKFQDDKSIKKHFDPKPTPKQPLT